MAKPTFSVKRYPNIEDIEVFEIRGLSLIQDFGELSDLGAQEMFL